jgi:hypothetical protein
VFRVVHQQQNEMKQKLFKDLNEERSRSQQARQFLIGVSLNLTELLEQPYKTIVGQFQTALQARKQKNRRMLVNQRSNH